MRANITCAKPSEIDSQRAAPERELMGEDDDRARAAKAVVERYGYEAAKNHTVAKLEPQSHLSEEEFCSWLLVPEALEFLAEGGVTVYSTTLIDRLKYGVIRAAAKHFGRSGATENYFIIPMTVWNSAHPGEGFWKSGDVRFKRRLTGTTFATDHAFEVRIDPASLAAMVPSPTVQPVTDHAAKPKRGRPKADYWEDLWAEIVAQILSGELSASKPVHIEKAMLDWAERNGKSLTESTARLRARAVFALVNKKADKSGR